MSENTIVVTGCTRGIGRAICDLFASEGYRVGGYARNAKELREMSDQYASLYPGRKFLFLQADAADKQSVIDAGKQFRESFGEITVLVNNAGFYRQGRILEEEPGALESMIDTNLYSAYHMTRALNTSIKSHIITICSIASLAAYEGGASYTISKFALLGFSRQLRHELKNTGVRVTAILPGAVRTGSWDGTALPQDRFIQPEDIAKTLLNICSMSTGADIEEIIIRPQQGDI